MSVIWLRYIHLQNSFRFSLFTFHLFLLCTAAATLMKQNQFYVHKHVCSYRWQYAGNTPHLWLDQSTMITDTFPLIAVSHDVVYNHIYNSGTGDKTLLDVTSKGRKAPSKELMSYRTYREISKLNSLRLQALRLFQVCLCVFSCLCVCLCVRLTINVHTK